MINEKKADCIIEQFHTMKDVKGFNIEHKPETFKPFWDTVAITRVYLRPEFKEQMQNEFPYTY